MGTLVVNPDVRNQVFEVHLTNKSFIEQQFGPTLPAALQENGCIFEYDLLS